MSKKLIGLKLADGTFYPVLNEGIPVKKHLKVTASSDNQTSMKIELFRASDESFADEFFKWGYGIVDDLWTTNWGAMRRIQIPVPPLDEQETIAEYLDNKIPQIEGTITDKQTQIETLKSYKASLIYEYVTGKKQVI